MSVVEQPVEDGVAEGRIADDIVPVVYGDLAGEQRAAAGVAVVEDLEEVVASLVGPLLARAERIDTLDAVRVVCDDPATRNQRLVDGKPAPAEGPTIKVGGAENYEARCRRCHVVPKRGRAQRALGLPPP